MIYSRKQLNARQAVGVARQALRRWERRYDQNSGADPMRFVAQIKRCEERYAQAVEALRLVRDGRRRLPTGEAAATATPPRCPTHDQAGN